MDLMKNFIEKNMPEKAAPDVTVGDTVRVHLQGQGRQPGADSGVRGNGHRQEARRHQRDLHRAPDLLWRRCGEGVPSLQPCH